MNDLFGLSSAGCGRAAQVARRIGRSFKKGQDLPLFARTCRIQFDYQMPCEGISYDNPRDTSAKSHR